MTIMRHHIAGLLLVVGSAFANLASAQGAQCADRLNALCLEVLGAGSVAAAPPNCRAQIEAYRDCIADLASQAQPPADNPTAEAEARQAYDAAKRANSRELLDLVGQRFPGTFWGQKAKLEAAAMSPPSLRPAERRPPTPPNNQGNFTGQSLQQVEIQLLGQMGLWRRTGNREARTVLLSNNFFMVMENGPIIGAGSIVRANGKQFGDFLFFDVVYGRVATSCSGRAPNLDAMTNLGRSLDAVHYAVSDRLIERLAVSYPIACPTQLDASGMG